MHACSVGQSCPTLFDPMDCSPPGSSVHGIFQARILEWIAISFRWSSSRGFSLTQRSNTHLLCLLHCHMDSLPLRHLESPVTQINWDNFKFYFTEELDTIKCKVHAFKFINRYSFISIHPTALIFVTINDVSFSVLSPIAPLVLWSQHFCFTVILTVLTMHSVCPKSYSPDLSHQ